MNDGTAREAREGLGKSLTGKAKELAGAILGNDSLTAEGRLQQVEAKARRDASTEQALARSKAQQAAETLADQAQRADEERVVAIAAAEARMENALEEGQIEVRRAEAEAEAQRVAEVSRADEEARAEARRIVRRAEHEEAEAARVERRGAVESDELRDRADAAADAAARARELAARLNP